jgi:hypothetical protein
MFEFKLQIIQSSNDILHNFHSSFGVMFLYNYMDQTIYNSLLHLHHRSIQIPFGGSLIRSIKEWQYIICLNDSTS